MATNLFIFWISKFCIKSFLNKCKNEGKYKVCRANFTHKTPVCVCIAVFFQFKAFHVIRTPFIFYLFFNIRGSERSFMRLSYHAVLIHCDVFKAIFTDRTCYKCYVLWFLPLRCHTFTLYRPHIVPLMPYTTVFLDHSWCGLWHLGRFLKCIYL